MAGGNSAPRAAKAGDCIQSSVWAISAGSRSLTGVDATAAAAAAAAFAARDGDMKLAPLKVAASSSAADRSAAAAVLAARLGEKNEASAPAPERIGVDMRADCPRPGVPWNVAPWRGGGGEKGLPWAAAPTHALRCCCCARSEGEGCDWVRSGGLGVDWGCGCCCGLAGHSR